MNVRDLHSRFVQKEADLRQREFLSPYTKLSTKVHVKIDGVVHPFRITGHKGNGFGIFRPVDGVCAKFVKDAPFDMARAFLDILPCVHLILCFETDHGWVAYPMNEQSSRRVIGLAGETIVYNVSDVERFDNIVARFDGACFWYDAPFMGGNLQKSDFMRQSFDPKNSVFIMKQALNRISGLTPEDCKAFDLALDSWTAFQKTTTEDRIRSLLECGGGRLFNYVVRGANIDIKWLSERGDTFSTLVNKETLDVVSAGICLAGEDSKFHLKDLPYLVREGERRHLVHITRWDDEDDEDRNSY